MWSLQQVSGRSTTVLVASEKREEVTYAKFRERLGEDFAVRQAPRRHMDKAYDHENSEVLVCKLRRGNGGGVRNKGGGRDSGGDVDEGKEDVALRGARESVQEGDKMEEEQVTATDGRSAARINEPIIDRAGKPPEAALAADASEENGNSSVDTADELTLEGVLLTPSPSSRENDCPKGLVR